MKLTKESIGDLGSLLERMLKEENPHLKGELLEEFLEESVARDSSLEIIRKHTSSETGSIDYIIEVKDKVYPLDISPWIAVECKNWSGPIDVKEIDHLRQLVNSSGPFVSLGIFITTSHLEPAAYASLRDARVKGECTIVPIEGKHLRQIVNEGLSSVIKKRCIELISTRSPQR